MRNLNAGYNKPVGGVYGRADNTSSRNLPEGEEAHQNRFNVSVRLDQRIQQHAAPIEKQMTARRNASPGARARDKSPKLFRNGV